MLTEHDLLQAVRATLAGEQTVAQLARSSGEALADHVADLETPVGRLAVALASLCTELHDGAVDATNFRTELQALLRPQLVRAHARLPVPRQPVSIATGASAGLTEREYRAPAAE
jgi:hypothetical protein